MQYRGGYEKSAHLYDLLDQKYKAEFLWPYGRRLGEVLDAGAGIGGLAIPTGETGVAVYCIEASPAMRRDALKRAIPFASMLQDNAGERW